MADLGKNQLLLRARSQQDGRHWHCAKEVHPKALLRSLKRHQSVSFDNKNGEKGLPKGQIALSGQWDE